MFRRRRRILTVPLSTPQLHPPLHHTSCCSGPAQPGAHVLVLEGPAQRLHLSITPPPLMGSGGADTDPLCEAQGPRNCSCRTGAQKRPEAWLAKAGPETT